jgi:hypothetical protein
VWEEFDVTHWISSITSGGIVDAGNIFGQPALMNPEFDLIQDAEITFSASMCFSFAVQVV